jgi:ribose 5-phosphate isomerase B
MKNIYLATDHAGFNYKEKVKDFLKNKFSEKFEIFDCGAENLNPDDDYPDFVSIAAKKVSESPDNSLGIIFGGSGQGEAMVANRYKNVRATVFYGGNKEILKLSKIHNNANILSIGERFVDEKDLEEIILV